MQLFHLWDPGLSILLIATNSQVDDTAVGLRVEDGGHAGRGRSQIAFVPLAPAVKGFSIIGAVSLKGMAGERIFITPVYKHDAPDSSGNAATTMLKLSQLSESPPRNHYWRISKQDAPILNISEQFDAANVDQTKVYVFQSQKRGDCLQRHRWAFDDTTPPSFDVSIDIANDLIANRPKDKMYNRSFDLTIEWPLAGPNCVETWVKVSQYLAAADVCRLLGGEPIRQVDPPQWEVRMKKRKSYKETVRLHHQGANVQHGIGFLDRIAIKTETDAILEFNAGDRKVVRSDEGLLVLTYLGNGDFVEEKGRMRDILRAQRAEELREKLPESLERYAKVEGNNYPSPATSYVSVPVELACYQLCKDVTKAHPADASHILPLRVDHFTRRPEHYFMLRSSALSKAAIKVNHISPVADAEDWLLAVAARAIDTELASRGNSLDHPKAIEAFCADFHGRAWRLIEMIGTGAASKLAEAMVRVGNRDAADALGHLERVKSQVAKTRETIEQLRQWGMWPSEDVGLILLDNPTGDDLQVDTLWRILADLAAEAAVACRLFSNPEDARFQSVYLRPPNIQSENPQIMAKLKRRFSVAMENETLEKARDEIYTHKLGLDPEKLIRRFAESFARLLHDDVSVLMELATQLEASKIAERIIDEDQSQDEQNNVVRLVQGANARGIVRKLASMKTDYALSREIIEALTPIAKRQAEPEATRNA